MNNDQVPEELSKLQKKLYRRGAVFGDERSTLPPLEINPQTTTWRPPTEGDINNPMSKPKPFPFVKFILVVATVFFVGAVGLAGFQYFFGLNVISGANIDLSIDGPEKTNAGEVLQITVATANRNQKDLEDVRLSAVFPLGTKEPKDPTKPLREIREQIGTISSGQAVVKTFKGLVYGEEKEQKKIDFTIEYRITGSNAVFTKKASYNFTIGSSPVRVVVTMPEEINSGQPLSIEIEASANAQIAVPDLALIVSYPPGFTFTNATPAPTNSNNIWSLSKLAAGQTTKIKINGMIEGQDDDAKSFQIHAGTLADPADQDLAVEYNTIFKTLTLRRPFVDLDISVDNGSAEIVDSVKSVLIDIKWANTLPVEVRNGQIEVTINGEAVNEQAIVTRGGHYDSQTNTAAWNKNDAALGVISRGGTGSVGFTLTTHSFLSGVGSSLNRPTIDLKVKFTGVRASGPDQSAPIEVETSKTLKVNTVAQLVSRGLYHTGAFSSVGPMPPKVGQETLYTIEWTVLNSTNDIKEAKVVAVVPVGLRYVGTVSPSGEKVTFNQTDRTVTWDINTIKAGSTVGGGRREASFQLGLTPSANQIDTSPTLITNTVFMGIDTFTQKVLNVSVPDVDIRLFKDPLFKVISESKVTP